MSLSDIQEQLDQAFPECQNCVETDGHTYKIKVIGTVFNNLNAVKRQQLVYKAINDLIVDGRVHAVSIQALTPNEV
jgi:acid stress-induced BolA-like protein IbaG/YrbA